MQETIIEIMNQFGYWGIVLLIAIENIFPPIPSEVILTFGGFMTTVPNSTLTIWGVILTATLGSILGAIVLYGVGRLLNAERLERWVDGRIGRVLHFKKEDIQKAEGWFNKRGRLTVLFCRCIPVVRSLISIPAGMAKMPMGIFLLLTTIGSCVWNIILVYLGAAAGNSWEVITGYIGTYSHIVLIVLIVVVVLAALLFYWRRLSKKARASQEDLNTPKKG